MSDAWAKGLSQYRRGNPFAAIEVWERAVSAASGIELAQVFNGIGASVDQVRGPAQAQPYFERALHVLSQQGKSDLRYRCAANLAAVLGRLNQTDQGLEIVRHHAAQPHANPSLDEAHNLSVQTYVFLKREMYSELVDIVTSWERNWNPQFDELDPVLRGRWATALHNCASAYTSLGQTEEALAYYQKSQRFDQTIQTTRELARIALLRGSVHEAIAVSREIYDRFWSFLITSEKSSIARSIELIGTFAYYAGRIDLFRRCVEKAEVYFGQHYQWSDWLRMRDLQSELAQYRVDVDPDALDWENWHALLDCLNLIDGMEAMFPNLYHVARMTATYAARLYQTVHPEDTTGKRDLQVAGRLVLLGLTIQAPSEGDAEAILTAEGASRDTAVLGARLLDAYPHAGHLRDLVLDAWPYASASSVLRDDAACLRIALRYIELVMLSGLTHSEAVTDVETNPPAGIEPSIVNAFLELFAA